MHCSRTCVYLQATGGSGFYNWHTDNISVANAGEDGRVFSSNNVGDCQIIAKDAKNPRHTDSIKVR